jgi:hypothetical protein
MIIVLLSGLERFDHHPIASGQLHLALPCLASLAAAVTIVSASTSRERERLRKRPPAIGRRPG